MSFKDIKENIMSLMFNSIMLVAVIIVLVKVVNSGVDTNDISNVKVDSYSNYMQVGNTEMGYVNVPSSFVESNRLSEFDAIVYSEPNISSSPIVSIKKYSGFDGLSSSEIEAKIIKDMGDKYKVSNYYLDDTKIFHSYLSVDKAEVFFTIDDSNKAEVIVVICGFSGVSDDYKKFAENVLITYRR